MNASFICPLLARQICNQVCNENPRYISYHVRKARTDAERAECYMEHMWHCSRTFCELYPKFGPTFKRLLRTYMRTNAGISDELIETSMRLMVALHDVGKLTVEYQSRITYFRHEIPGFYLLTRTNILNELTGRSDYIVHALKLLSAVAVYIMHEAILIKYEREELRFPSMIDLLEMLEEGSWRIHFLDDYAEVAAMTLEMFGLKSNVVNELAGIKELDGKAIAEAVRKCATRLGRDPAIRLIVASLTKFLKDVDDEAARLGRLRRQ